MAEYYIVLLQISRHYLQQQHEHGEELFVATTRKVLECFASANAALHKTLSIYLISSYASLSSIVSHPSPADA